MVAFSDTLHKVRVHENLCVTEKKWGKISQKLQGKLSAVAPKIETFWGFFFQINGYIVLLNNNICNFLLGHNDLKLNSYVNFVAVVVV